MGDGGGWIRLIARSWSRSRSSQLVELKFNYRSQVTASVSRWFVSFTFVVSFGVSFANPSSLYNTQNTRSRSKWFFRLNLNRERRKVWGIELVSHNWRNRFLFSSPLISRAIDITILTQLGCYGKIYRMQQREIRARRNIQRSISPCNLRFFNYLRKNMNLHKYLPGIRQLERCLKILKASCTTRKCTSLALADCKILGTISANGLANCTAFSLISIIQPRKGMFDGITENDFRAPIERHGGNSVTWFTRKIFSFFFFLSFFPGFFCSLTARFKTTTRQTIGSKLRRRAFNFPYRYKGWRNQISRRWRRSDWSFERRSRGEFWNDRAPYVENCLFQNSNIFSVLSIFKWNEIGETNNKFITPQ